MNYLLLVNRRVNKNKATTLNRNTISYVDVGINLIWQTMKYMCKYTIFVYVRIYKYTQMHIHTNSYILMHTINKRKEKVT